MISITIYTTNTCATCAHVKKFLTFKGFTYNLINLDDEPEKRAEAIRISGAMTVPITVIDRGESRKVVIGLNLPSLAAAIA